MNKWLIDDKEDTREDKLFYLVWHGTAIILHTFGTYYKQGEHKRRVCHLPPHYTQFRALTRALGASENRRTLIEVIVDYLYEQHTKVLPETAYRNLGVALTENWLQHIQQCYVLQTEQLTNKQADYSQYITDTVVYV